MSTTVGSTTITYNDSTSQGTAYVGHNAQVFTSSGTFTTPPGITRLKVTLFGGGAGGPSSAAQVGPAGFGVAVVTTSGGTSYAVTVGSGGAGNYGSATSSSFGSLATASGSGGTSNSYLAPYGAFSSNGTVLTRSRNGFSSWNNGGPTGANGGIAAMMAYTMAIGGGFPGFSGPGGASAGASGGGGGGASGGGTSATGPAPGPLGASTMAVVGQAYGVGSDGNYGTSAGGGNYNGGSGGGPTGGAGGASYYGPLGKTSGYYSGGGGGGGGAVIVEW